MGKYDVGFPEYSDDLTRVAAMFAQAGKVVDGVTLFAAAASLRSGVVTVSTADKGGKTTGISDAAKVLGVAKGTVSKGVKVLLARVPELQECPKSEVGDRVRAFLVGLEVGGETLSSVYKSLSVRREPNGGESDDGADGADEDDFETVAAKATALFATAIAYARKNGLDVESVYAAALGC